MHWVTIDAVPFLVWLHIRCDELQNQSLGTAKYVQFRCMLQICSRAMTSKDTDNRDLYFQARCQSFRIVAYSQEACDKTSSPLVSRSACTIPYFVLRCVEIWGHMSCL